MQLASICLIEMSRNECNSSNSSSGAGCHSVEDNFQSNYQTVAMEQLSV
jgi:hypothetical protein